VDLESVANAVVALPTAIKEVANLITAMSHWRLGRTRVQALEKLKETEAVLKKFSDLGRSASDYIDLLSGCMDFNTRLNVVIKETVPVFGTATVARKDYSKITEDFNEAYRTFSEKLLKLAGMDSSLDVRHAGEVASYVKDIDRFMSESRSFLEQENCYKMTSRLMDVSLRLSEVIGIAQDGLSRLTRDFVQYAIYSILTA